MANKIGWKMAFVAVVIGLALSGVGCAVLSAVGIGAGKGVETETSKMLLNGATDIIMTKENGIVPDAFKVLFERQFSVTDFRLNLFTATGGNMTFTYKDRKYTMSLAGESNEQGNRMVKIISVSRCLDTTPAE